MRSTKYSIVNFFVTDPPQTTDSRARPEMQGVKAARVFCLAGAARRLLTAGISVTIGSLGFVNIYPSCFLMLYIK
ncbi:MAG: hypothetical protein J5U17_08630 [Candidatus Methanoperedens sp.]|nr:hypothetical protein [Candidatus Methanoperedens sp.]MCE8429175.1 hypothetical protein [Candidatus Methanoperedens sp.]